jgi:hypothetical protein
MTDLARRGDDQGDTRARWRSTTANMRVVIFRGRSMKKDIESGRPLMARYGVEVMDRKHARIQKPKGRREPWWTEVLPLDPRNPDVLRAKLAAYTARPGTSQPERGDRH